MTYQISKEIRILHEQDDWEFVFSTDEYGTVCFASQKFGLEAMTGKSTHIFIPKDCIQNVIDALEQLK